MTDKRPTDYDSEARTRHAKTPCGTINLIVDFEKGEKELTEGNFKELRFEYAKDGSCIQSHLDVEQDLITLCMNATAHKKSTMNKVKEIYRNRVCHLYNKEDVDKKVCLRSIVAILDKFFPEEKKEA
jgi:hypothetical protein